MGASGDGGRTVSARSAKGTVLTVSQLEHGLELPLLVQVVRRPRRLPAVAALVLVRRLKRDGKAVAMVRIPIHGVHPAIGQRAESRRQQDEPDHGKTKGASHHPQIVRY